MDCPPLRPRRRKSLPALALWVAWALAGCDGGGAEAAAPEGRRPTTVEVVRVEAERLRDVVPFSGQLESEHSVLLRPETSGVIEELLFEEGARVSAGDVLFQLRDDEEVARLSEARANLALAQDVYDRTQHLRSRDIASSAQQDRAIAQRKVARARVDLAQVELARTRVRAPFDGVVGARMVDPGDRVTPDDPMLQIDATERLQLVFAVPELGASAARTGIPVEAKVAAWPGERFPGEIFFVSPTVDPATRRLILKAWVPNEDGRLRPGMFVNVDVEISSKDRAIMIPESALVHDRLGPFVWRVGEEEKAERVPVEIGLRQAGRVEVTLGLQAGDRIVSAGTHKVSEGRAVRISEPAAIGQARGDALSERAGEGT